MSRDGELFGLAEPSFWERWWDGQKRSSYHLARFLILRLLGLVYIVAFATALEQGPGLLGSEGLTPAARYLDRVDSALGSRAEGFWQLPSIFWLHVSDEYLSRVAWIGLLLSLAVLLGYANAVILALLWFLHLSFVHVGQEWYAFGWEIQLLETGFLAIFLCPVLDGRPFSTRAPPLLVIWLYRWLIFRIMLGAGLIKLRGDACWRDLTCLAYYFETQPVPNPLSPWFHFMPLPLHVAGVLFNDLAELVAPFFVLGPARARRAAGVVLVSFQVALILSGNLSYLNWLTIVPALACFDDAFLERLLPGGIRRLWLLRPKAPLGRGAAIASAGVFVVVVLSSVDPVANLLSSAQVMNTSFTRLHLVNTYGAFGSVGRERLELVFEGTRADGPSSAAEWREYEFLCKPTGLDRRPCIVTPYHYRLDWLLWFAAMGNVRQYPWAAHLVWKLLENDPVVTGLLKENPFESEPPRFVRVELYRYRFAPLGSASWWERERLGSWLDATSRDDPRLRSLLKAQGFID